MRQKICCKSSKKTDRDKRSVMSNMWLCGLCRVETKIGFMHKDEYIKHYIDWEKLNTEFEEMCYKLGLIGDSEVKYNKHLIQSKRKYKETLSVLKF